MKNLEEIKKNENMLSSGETEDFTKMQSKFNYMLNEEGWKYNPVVEGQDTWCYDCLVDDKVKDEDKAKYLQALWENVNSIKKIPGYKYILMYLLMHHQLILDEKNLKGLWSYIESGKPEYDMDLADGEENTFRKRLRREGDEKLAEFTDEDYKVLLTILCNKMSDAYNDNGEIEFKDTFFKELLFKPDRRLHEFALAYRLEPQMYYVFRKKVLKTSAINFFDKDQILLSLVLKYAKDCGKYNYFECWKTLKEKYEELPSAGHKEASSDSGNDTMTIENKLRDYLEDSKGHLKEKFKTTLFETGEANTDKTLGKLVAYGATTDKKNLHRSAEKLFMEEWEEFEENFKKSEDGNFALEVNEDSENLLDVDMETMDETYFVTKKFFAKQNLYRWLYGTEVRQKRQNKKGKVVWGDRLNREMILLGEGKGDFFLDSKEFLETRIRDNTFSNFPEDEARQRNLLLTAVFFNFAFDGDNLSSKYEECVSDFELVVNRKLAEAGFQMLHSGNPYDAYLKLLLSCDMPLELFRYVWKLKTGSAE